MFSTDVSKHGRRTSEKMDAALYTLSDEHSGNGWKEERGDE